jgi:hypothetical protein
LEKLAKRRQYQLDDQDLMIFISLPYILRIGTLMNAENADFFLFALASGASTGVSVNQRFSASIKGFVR